MIYTDVSILLYDITLFFISNQVIDNEASTSDCILATFTLNFKIIQISEIKYIRVKFSFGCVTNFIGIKRLIALINDATINFNLKIKLLKLLTTGYKK